MKEIRIVSYLRSRDYESRFIKKVGNLGNHSKAEFIEIMHKIIVIMIIISDSCPIGVSADSCPAGAPWMRE